MCLSQAQWPQSSPMTLLFLCVMGTVSLLTKVLTKGWKLGRTASLVCCNYGRLQSSFIFSIILAEQQSFLHENCFSVCSLPFHLQQVAWTSQCVLVDLCHQDWPIRAHQQVSSFTETGRVMYIESHHTLLKLQTKEEKKQNIQTYNAELVIFHPDRHCLASLFPCRLLELTVSHTCLSLYLKTKTTLLVFRRHRNLICKADWKNSLNHHDRKLRFFAFKPKVFFHGMSQFSTNKTEKTQNTQAPPPYTTSMFHLNEEPPGYFLPLFLITTQIFQAVSHTIPQKAHITLKKDTLQNNSQTKIISNICFRIWFCSEVTILIGSLNEMILLISTFPEERTLIMSVGFIQLILTI